jgi:YHS domain-containing protein
MSVAAELVEQYLDAVYAGDAVTARRCLADQFSFVGPAVSINDPDQYLRATEHAARAVRRVDKCKVFVDGQDVCVFYDLRLDHAAVDSVSVAEWYHLEDDRIASIRTILDTAPLTSSASSATTDVAVDPVCTMSVDTASPPATRTHAGQIYYFCSRACAEAFEATPARYLQAA